MQCFLCGARIPLRRLSFTWYRRSRGATPLRVTVPSVKRIAAKDFYVEINLYQLFGVGALAHRGLSPVRGLVRAKPLAYPALHLSAREGCPGHCDTMSTGQISSRLGVNFNLDCNRNMPDHGLRPKASRQQEPRLLSQALTQGCISLLPYQLNNVKLHYLVVRNEALHSGEGVPGADYTAARNFCRNVLPRP